MSGPHAVKLPRQPMPVRIVFEGEEKDVRYYMARIRSVLNVSHDEIQHIVEPGPKHVLMIYPAAVNA